MTYEVLRASTSGGPLSLVLNGARDLRDALVGGAMAAREAAAEMLGRPAHTLAVIGGLLGGVAAMPKSADAAIVDLSREPQHNLLGDRPGTLYSEYELQIPGGSVVRYGVSAFTLGKEVDQNGNHVRTFVSEVLHPYADVLGAGLDTTKFAVGDGTNRNTNRGRQFENLTEVYRSPHWNPSAPWMNAGDLVIWSTTTEVPDSWIPTLAPLNSATQGDIAFVAGFSRLGTPATGLLPATGDSYGYFAEIRDAVPLNVQGGTHKSLDFDVSNALANNGASEIGGSGEWVFDSQSRLIGAVVTGTGAPTDTFRRTQFNNFTHPEFHSQVAPYSGIQVVPEPASLALILGGSGIVMMRRRRTPSGSEV